MMRIEEDQFGKMPIYQEAYYGIASYRQRRKKELAVDQKLIQAYGDIKQAAAFANFKTGKLTEAEYLLLEKSSQEMKQGQFHQEVIVAATKQATAEELNQNINEILVNRSLELAGKNKGDYQAFPLDSVNHNQASQTLYTTGVILASRAYQQQLAEKLHQFLLYLNKLPELNTASLTELQKALHFLQDASFETTFIPTIQLNQSDPIWSAIYLEKLNQAKKIKLKFPAEQIVDYTPLPYLAVLAEVTEAVLNFLATQITSNIGVMRELSQPFENIEAHSYHRLFAIHADFSEVLTNLINENLLQTATDKIAKLDLVSCLHQVNFLKSQISDLQDEIINQQRKKSS